MIYCIKLINNKDVMKSRIFFIITLLTFSIHTIKTMDVPLQLNISLKLIDIYKVYEESKNDQNNQYATWFLFYLLEMRFTQDAICVASNNERIRLFNLFAKQIKLPFPDYLNLEQSLNAKCQAILYINSKVLPPVENLITFVETIFNNNVRVSFIESFSCFLMQTSVLEQEYPEDIISSNNLFYSSKYSQRNFKIINSTN